MAARAVLATVFQDTKTVLVNPFDLIAGDDPDSFKAEFLPRIQEDAQRISRGVAALL